MKRWTVSLPNPDGYDIKPFDTTFHTPQEIVLAADHNAEVERLRIELDSFQRRFIAVDEVLKARTRESEIEELRTERAELAERITDMLMPEIKRLRGDNAVLDAEAAKAINGLRDTNREIEQLRELLREAHLALSFMPDPTRKLLDLRYRVRKALGE